MTGFGPILLIFAPLISLIDILNYVKLQPHRMVPVISVSNKNMYQKFEGSVSRMIFGFWCVFQIFEKCSPDHLKNCCLTFNNKRANISIISLISKSGNLVWQVLHYSRRSITPLAGGSYWLRLLFGTQFYACILCFRPTHVLS